MLSIYLDIVDEAKRAINKNIWYMFELLESNCAALSYEEILQVIELKYKLPIESTSDLINLDAMLNKAYNQIKIAEEMVEGNKTFILEEYFGESFKGIIPDFVDYFVITNYSVGTGRNCILPSPIILESHYLSMMKLNNGMYNVHYALSDNGKGYIQHVEKRYARYLLSGYKIMVPEYLFKINAPRV